MAWWQKLAARLDSAVDDYFAEEVEFHPMIQAGAQGPARRDPKRKVLVTMGIYVRPGAAATGEGGMASIGVSTRQVADDLWVSICDERLSKTTVRSWQAYDRVFFPERNEWYEITYAAPSATARPQFYLTRVQDVDVVT